MSLAHFLSMGGYAFYVWGAYGVVALALTVELLQLRSRRRADLRRAQHAHERKVDCR